MKRILTVLAGSVAVGILPAVPASAAATSAAAYPVKSAALTDNPLYSAGPLPVGKCPEKPVKKLNAGSAKSYLNSVLTCLDDTWSAHLEKAGVKWSKPRVTYVTKAPAKFCQVKWDKDWDAYYCDASRTIQILLSKRLLEEPEDLFLFNLLATYYGEHVQNMAGVFSAWQDMTYRNKSELAEQDRRYSLQNVCFSGAFIGSVWKSLHRSKDEWDDLLYFVRGWESKHDGTRKSLTYWINQGFKSADPGSCNTWSAPSSKVA
ncbi:hypothetical protein [Sphaerisporangium fuscum]|uniref:hypothetical protein n=1 Tax=Sphaerisporangium fuscum TaxID=2835868 RepID=UPI001BDBB71C|nr:hypothetical protein [Sphaerisporangium fuscum]